MNEKNSPLVSIIIPVYNREKVIGRALDSALRQTYKNIEIICCDNCSEDNTFSVLEEYAKKDNRIKLFHQKKNLGPVRNWLTGFEKSQGDYVKFLWSDDVIHDECIERLMIGFNDKDVGYSYSAVQINFETKGVILDNVYQFGSTGKYNSIDYLKSALNLYPREVPVSPGCALFPRYIVKKYLRVDFDNDLNLDFSRYGAGNDLLIFLGACEEKDKFYYVNEVLSVFYGGVDSFSIANNLLQYYDFVRSFFLEHIYTKDLSLKVKYDTIQHIYYKKKIATKLDYVFFFKWCIMKVSVKIKKLFHKI